MSSSIDDVECPNCGHTARREQYTESDDVNIHCPHCDWTNEYEVFDSPEVKIVWKWEDVQSLQPDWTPYRCQQALRLIGKRLKDRSIETGYDYIHDLLLAYSEEIDSAEEEEHKDTDCG